MTETTNDLSLTVSRTIDAPIERVSTPGWTPKCFRAS